MWQKGTGLMFRFPRGEFAFIFPFSTPRHMHITMFFVFYSIDVLFLDATGSIVELVSLRPFTHYSSRLQATTFVELPKGTIAKHNLHVGQLISWSDNSVDV